MWRGALCRVRYRKMLAARTILHAFRRYKLRHYVSQLNTLFRYTPVVASAAGTGAWAEAEAEAVAGAEAEAEAVAGTVAVAEAGTDGSGRGRY